MQTPNTQQAGVSRLEILLTHEEYGPVWVSVWDEATWWMNKRIWTITGDEERGSFEDADFEETPSQIDEELAKASEPYDEHEDTHCAMRVDPRAFSRW